MRNRSTRCSHFGQSWAGWFSWFLWPHCHSRLNLCFNWYRPCAPASWDNSSRIDLKKSVFYSICFVIIFSFPLFTPNLECPITYALLTLILSSMTHVSSCSFHPPAMTFTKKQQHVGASRHPPLPPPVRSCPSHPVVFAKPSVKQNETSNIYGGKLFLINLNSKSNLPKLKWCRHLRHINVRSRNFHSHVSIKLIVLIFLSHCLQCKGQIAVENWDV